MKYNIPTIRIAERLRAAVAGQNGSGKPDQNCPDGINSRTAGAYEADE